MLGPSTSAPRRALPMAVALLVVGLARSGRAEEWTSARVPARCAFTAVPLREPPKTAMWRDERFPSPGGGTCPDVTDLRAVGFVRECPLCGQDRHHVRFLFPARDDFGADLLLGLYDRTASRHEAGRRAYALRGRVRVVRRRPDDLMEAELLSAAGFHPHLGWVDESLSPERVGSYVLSPLNRTRLDDVAFRRLLRGEIWRGMTIGHFACVAPSTPERALHLDRARRKGMEHWITGVWPRQRHYVFRNDRLVAWYPKAGDPCPLGRPHPRGRDLPLFTGHGARGCVGR